MRLTILNTSSAYLLRNLPIPYLNKTPIPPTKAQHRDLTHIIAALPPPSDRPLGFDIFNRQNIKVIIVKEGHPFTRGTDIIVFNEAFFQKSFRVKFEIFIHELVHLHQRQYPELYERYYNDQGFVKAVIYFTGALADKLMFNPDGENYEWVWTYRNRAYVPLAIGHRAYIAKMGRLRGWQPVTPKNIVPVEEVPEYYNFFGVKNQLYHPNEIVAHQIAKQYQ
jgi:hypothetical protein